MSRLQGSEPRLKVALLRIGKFVPIRYEGLSIFSSTDKEIVENLLDAHPRLRKANLLRITPITLLHVLPKGELDKWRGALVKKLCGK